LESHFSRRGASRSIAIAVGSSSFFGIVVFDHTPRRMDTAATDPSGRTGRRIHTAVWILHGPSARRPEVIGAARWLRAVEKAR
jgi:hypothetical protein